MIENRLTHHRARLLHISALVIALSLNVAIARLAIAQRGDTIYTIEVLQSFPTEEDSVLLIQPAQIEFCDGSLFVSDFRAPALAKYSTTGRLREWRSSPGQGPEEFNLISKIACDSGRIYLVDDGNSRIQMYTHELEHQDSFKVPGLTASDISASGGTIYIADRRIRGDGSISVYSENGALLNRFGGYVSAAPDDLKRRVTNHVIRSKNGLIVALSLHYPEIKLLDPSSGDEQTILLVGNGRDYKERTAQNYDWEALGKDPRITPLRYLFRSFDFTDERVFVGLYDTRSLIIDEYGWDGQFIQRHESERFHDLSDYYLYDFAVTDVRADGVEIAILSNNPLPQVSMAFIRTTHPKR